jgi:ResB-like family
MSQTAIQTKPDDFTPGGPDLTPRREPRTAGQWVKLILSPIASLRLTVVLFAMSMFLVFCGTVAQKTMGLWTTMDEYFRSGLAWIPFQIFVEFGKVFLGLPETASLGGKFPFPGGWLLGGLLLLNLLAAHAVRFRISWKRSGILLIHTGLVVLMLSELFTGLLAVEANMTIAEGETVNFVDVSREIELALTDPSDPEVDDVVVVPGAILRKGGTVRDDQLPVDVEVLQYSDNSSLVPAREVREEKKRYGIEVKSAVGFEFLLFPRAEESGVTSERMDLPMARVRFLDKRTGKSLGEHVFSLWFYRNSTKRLPVYRFEPGELRVGQKRYAVELRPRRIYKSYAIHLIDFQFKRYIGTQTPKDFTSVVRLEDASRGEHHQLKISMNAPLRHAGDTLYQSSYMADEKGTVLQAVENPSWLLPYVSCALVSLGMIIHFGLHLAEFLRRRAAG